MLHQSDFSSPDLVVRAGAPKVAPADPCPVQSSLGGGECRQAEGAQPLLGSTANTVGRDAAEKRSKAELTPQEKRSEKLVLQRLSAKLLPEQRVAHCLWTVSFNAKEEGGVRLLSREKMARFRGVQTCGSVWACPVCMSRVNNVRKGELQHALDWAAAKGLFPLLMTLTARHGKKDRLDELLEKMREAKRRFQQRRDYKALKASIVATITAFEVTHGSQSGIPTDQRKAEKHSGWHPHFHVVVFVKAASEDDAIKSLRTLKDGWLVSLQAQGLSGNGAAFDVRSGSQVAEYVTKFGHEEERKQRKADLNVIEGAEVVERPAWGMAEEVTLAHMKRAKLGRKSKAGRSPMQLLRDAVEDPYSAGLWQVYARAFRGRKQLTWTQYFKAEIGLGEVSDEEAAEVEEFTKEEDTVHAVIPIEHWPRARKHRAALLNAAESENPDQEVKAILDPILSGPKPKSMPKSPREKALERHRANEAAQLRIEAAGSEPVMADLLKLMADAIEPLRPVDCRN